MKHGIRSPLQEAGLKKENIRILSQLLGLRTWDKPSSPCLSSRFPYGGPITEEALRMVASADTLLAVRDSSGNGKGFGVKNGAVDSTDLSFGSLAGRGYLMDDQGSDGSDYIYLIYASSGKVAPDNKENTPLTRRMAKNTAIWEPYI